MNKRLIEYFTKVHKETGITVILQEVLYNKYGYVLKKVK